MNSAITAFFEMLKQFFQLREADIEHKPTSDAIKDKKTLKKASNITEQILEITDKYIESFEEKDAKKYEKLKKRFLKYN